MASPEMQRVLYGAPFARGEPADGDFELGIVGCYNALDRAYSVQWESRPEATPMCESQIVKYEDVGHVEEDGHITFVYEAFNARIPEGWHCRVRSLVEKVTTRELDQWRRGKRRRVEQVDADTGTSSWQITLREAPAPSPPPFALTTMLSKKLVEVKEEAAEAHELNTPLSLHNDYLQAKVDDLHAALRISDEQERLVTGQKIVNRSYHEWLREIAASAAATASAGAASDAAPDHAVSPVVEAASQPPLLELGPDVYEDGPHVDDSWRLSSSSMPWKRCNGPWTPPLNKWTGAWSPQRKRVAAQLTELHGSEAEAWRAGWRWAAEPNERKSGAREHIHHYWPPSAMIKTHLIEVGIAGLLDGQMKELLPKLLSADACTPAPLASPTSPALTAGPYTRRQLFHRNALVPALGMKSLGSGGPCVTTRNTAEFLGHNPTTPVVCLNALWHPEAPLFAGAPTAKLYCHGDCQVGEIIEAFVQRFTSSGQILGWEYLGRYQQSSHGDACFADMRGPTMASTRRKYADALLEQQNMWELLLVCAERVGVSLQMSDCEKRNKTAVAAVKTVIEAAERRGDVFPATSIELVGYNEDLYQLLMEKKAYEYKTSSYEGRVWEGES